MKILICGCGALGSQVALHLARPDREFVLLDDDTVSETNINTSVYWLNHIRMRKVDALAAMMWRKCECKAIAWHHTLVKDDIARSKKFDTDIIIDTFDNLEARLIVAYIGFMQGITAEVVHMGVSEEKTGEVLWNNHWKNYELNGYLPGRGDNPICTHELGAPILRFTAALGANIVEEWIATGRKRDVIIGQNWTVIG